MASDKSTTAVMENFLGRPFKDTILGDGKCGIPGVGPAIAKKLNDVGIKTAEQLLGKWLLLGKDKAKFEEWMEEEVGVRAQDVARGNTADALDQKWNSMRQN